MHIRWNQRRLLFGCLSLGLLSAIVLGGAVITTRYTQYRNAEGGADLNPTPPQIFLQLAQDESFVAGSPIMAPVSALGYDPFLSAELWVDGVLAGVDAAPSGGVTPFYTEFTWLPVQPGLHQLIARATDTKSNVATSNAVLVVVLPDETLADEIPEGGEEDSTGEGTSGGGAVPVVFPAAPAAPPPAPPGSNDPVGESQPWQGLPGDWINSLTTDSAPNKPGLIGKEYGCGAYVYIQDLSDNEEGFRVYRQALKAPAWSEVAVLASQNQNEWIKFTDEGVSGPISYYVTAFNSQGETSSDLVTVLVPYVLADVENPCQPKDQSDDLPILTVTLANLFPKIDVEQSYCYQSLGGLLWNRLPESGFYTPGEISGVVSQLLLTDPDGQPLFEHLDLYLECWGWSGGELQFLGASVQPLDLSNPGEVQVDLGSISAQVLVNIGKVSDLTPPIELFPMEEEGFPFVFDLDIAKKLLFSFPVESAQMPFISAWITYDPDHCTAHLEPEAQNMFGSLTLCQPYPGYNIGPGGVNPQPYFVWSVLNNTCGGNDCKPHQFWVQYPKVKGYDLRFRWLLEVSAPGSNISYRFFLDQAFRTSWLPHAGLGCEDGTPVMRVRMGLFPLGDDSAYLLGPPSNWVKIPCSKPIEDTVVIEVTFETLQLSNVDDNDNYEPQRLEVYGRFGARSEAQPGTNLDLGFVYVGEEPLKTYNCHNPDSSSSDSGLIGCVNLLRDGTYPLATEYLCIDNSPNSPPLWQCVTDEWAEFNNSLLITVRNGSAIKLAADLIDDDVSSGDDPVCITSLWTEPKSLLQWATTANETYTLSANHDNADCKVNVVLNAVTP